LQRAQEQELQAQRDRQLEKGRDRGDDYEL
jgi:hypothetical protein